MECDQSGIISGEEVFGTLFYSPVPIIMQFFVTLTGKELTAPIDHMEGGRSSIDKF